MKNNTKGEIGEKLAVEYLKKLGFEIIETNWRYSHSGEIDIIAFDKNNLNPDLVFIEVKTRSSTRFGHPIEAITPKKMNTMTKLAEIYIGQKKDIDFKSLRFDVVGVILGKKPEILYYKDIYQF